MWRHLTPERLVSFSSYAVSAGDHPRRRLLGDGRHSGGQPLLLEELLPLWRQVPVGPALHARLRATRWRARSYPRSLVQQYTQISAGRGGSRTSRTTLTTPSTTPRSRSFSGSPGCWPSGQTTSLGGGPVRPDVGPTLPLLLNDSFRPTTLGQQLPVYAAWLLTGALASLIVLVFIEDQLAHRGPKSGGSG